jgi:hypothetical protein
MVSDSEYNALKEKYDELLEKTAAFGIDAYEQLSQVQKDRLMVMRFLRDKHGAIKYSPQTLYLLPPGLRQECRDFLHVHFAGNPYANRRIDEIFARPKYLRVRDDKRASP